MEVRGTRLTTVGGSQSSGATRLLVSSFSVLAMMSSYIRLITWQWVWVVVDGWRTYATYVTRF